ncbi:MAG TPA: toprim domain-containing protein [Bacilli bacterium]|nr:toprim domain-containing protein [Bacilli bacterium]
MNSCVFVVEGKTDKALLQSLTNNYIVITDGTNVSRETINHLQALEKFHNIVIITDPDINGTKISEKIGNSLNNPIIINVLRTEIKTKRKIGVAEMDRIALLNKISEYNYGTKIIATIDYYPFWEFSRLNLANKATKQAFLNEYSLMKGSTKSIHQQLQYLGITFKVIAERNT